MRGHWTFAMSWVFEVLTIKNHCTSMKVSTSVDMANAQDVRRICTRLTYRDVVHNAPGDLYSRSSCVNSYRH